MNCIGRQNIEKRRDFLYAAKVRRHFEASLLANVPREESEKASKENEADRVRASFYEKKKIVCRNIGEPQW